MSQVEFIWQCLALILGPISGLLVGHALHRGSHEQ